MASLFSLSSTRPKLKTHISTGTVPPFIDPKQPPAKRSPWRQLRETPFISTVTITLPNDLYTSTISPHLPQLQPSHVSRYAKLYLTLPQILTGDFFTTYIKTGNILLLSSGTPSVSNWVCSLREGTLRLEIAKEVYERCGLQGTPTDRNGGARKHERDRWVVELNLRAPSMVRGRKGFERLVRAAEEVLGEGRVWLFRNLEREKDGDDEGVGKQILEQFHPAFVDMKPDITDRRDVLVPTTVSTAHEISGPPSSRFHDDFHELVEWLDLVQLGSPRVTKDDRADPYICRYSVPDVDTATQQDLKVLTWTGLLDQTWVTQLLINVVRLSRKSRSTHWLALTVNAHRTEALGQVDGCTILLQPEGQGVGDGDAMDVGMEGAGEEPLIAKEDETVSGGFQRFTCFQFVDTVTI